MIEVSKEAQTYTKDSVDAEAISNEEAHIDIPSRGALNGKDPHSCNSYKYSIAMRN